MAEQFLTLIQGALGTVTAGGGLFGIYMYFRKIDAAIKEDLRKTIATQAEQIEKLWTECRNLRKELSGKHATDEPEADGG